MQTIQVLTTTDNGDICFSVNGNVLGKIWVQAYDYMSEVKREMHPYKCKQDFHTSNDDALEFVKNCITSYFGYAGIPVEFIKL